MNTKLNDSILHLRGHLVRAAGDALSYYSTLIQQSEKTEKEKEEILGILFRGVDGCLMHFMESSPQTVLDMANYLNDYYPVDSLPKLITELIVLIKQQSSPAPDNNSKE